MENYLDHDQEVKFGDSLLEQSQDWQWFIDLIEERYELCDVKSYNEFQERTYYYIEILQKLTKVVECCDREWTCNLTVSHDLLSLAKYFCGLIEKDTIILSIKSNIGKLLCIGVWFNKLRDSRKQSSDIADLMALNVRNYWQLADLRISREDELSIIEYLDSIQLNMFDKHKQCLKDNIEKKEYGISEQFFHKYKEQLSGPNVFKLHHIHREAFLSWQENMLLDIVSTSIKRVSDEQIKHTCSFFVNHEEWTDDLLGRLMTFFPDPLSHYLIETVNYVQNKTLPSNGTIDVYCEMLAEKLKREDAEAPQSYEYTILSSMLNEQVFRKSEKTERFKDLMKSIHSTSSIQIMMQLYNDGFPISKKQKKSVEYYMSEQYKEISEVSDYTEFLGYLKNRNNPKNITQEYYDMIMPSFDSIIQKYSDIRIAELFMVCMRFLVEVKGVNSKVDKQIVNENMIWLQEEWQNKYYETQKKNMHVIPFKREINAEMIRGLNKEILSNPRLLSDQCMFASIDQMVDAMESVSENAVNQLFRKIIISPIFPFNEVILVDEKHDIDKFHIGYIAKIIKKYNYRFINHMMPEAYLAGLHETYKRFASILIPLFIEEKKLYQILEKEYNLDLIPYSDSIQIGHLTQFFPLLEIAIRKLGSEYGIVPFKEGDKDYMKYKDPKSVLGDILKSSFSDSGSFEKVSDLLFVYHFLYNGNSYNIRNESIHGRYYTNGEQLKFAFKISELALYMVLFRNR